MKCILALAAVAVVAAGAVNAHDIGGPPQISVWLKHLKNPRLNMPCCNERDCARTEAHVRNGRWHAKAPDGSWIAIPTESVVTDQGNPTGETNKEFLYREADAETLLDWTQAASREAMEFSGADLSVRARLRAGDGAAAVTEGTGDHQGRKCLCRKPCESRPGGCVGRGRGQASAAA
jgi:hypothetical protein